MIKKESIYVAPMTKVVAVNAQAVLCTSGEMESVQNESYEERDTTGWF